MKKRWWAELAAGVVAVSGAATVFCGVGAMPSAAAAVGATSAPGGHLVWGDCPDASATGRGQRCSTVEVPLDYRHPNGRQIGIAVSRIPAADPAHRRGVLLLNPGGPGVEGLNQPLAFAAKATASARSGYDLIGFDPRGVGHSAPVTCGLDPSELMPPVPYPAPDGSIAANVAFAKSTAARCQAKSGELLPYITTLNAAQDMDRIRQALGEPRISYYGFSDGTYLGAAYATLFPRRTDRLVFDSAVDPARVWYDQIRLQSKGTTVRFADAAASAAANDAQLRFGATPQAVTVHYLALAARLDAHPATIPGVATALSGNVLRHLTVTALGQDDSIIPQLAQGWRAAEDLAAGRASVGEITLLQQVIGLIDPTAGTSPDVPQDNAIAAAYAFTCGDVRWPREVPVYARNVARARKAYPLAAGAPANITPCAFWPIAPIEPPVDVAGSASGHGPRNILILQNERDPKTTLESGRGMRKALGARSVLITIDAGGHGVYGVPGPQGTRTCASTAADAFLTDGTLPSHDLRCT